MAATPPVLAGLIARRAELAGEAAALETRLTALHASLTQLDATIRLFDPSYPAELIPPKRLPTGRELFQHKELTKLVLDVLRTATEPMTVPAVAREVMRRKGLPQDGRTRRIVCKRVDRALWRQARLLERVEMSGRAVGWRIAISGSR